jgi:uncharacterized protein
MTGIIASTTGLLTALGESLRDVWQPHLRLGVTGLSRAGKSVFTTALVHHLIAGTKMPVLKASAQGRIASAKLKPQAHADMPRFAYEANLAALLAGTDRSWPESTKRISELRLEIAFESRAGWFPGPRTLTLDIVDYPGEWLLDLALLNIDYGTWARRTIEDARKAHRVVAAAPWLATLPDTPADGPPSELAAEAASLAFKAYLAALRADPESVAVTPPGRFLMPGDLEGSPALTFAPLEMVAGITPDDNTLGGLMAQRFEAYKRLVVQPFFQNHFARLDRQIVLVDVLAALDRGPAALADLEAALADSLGAFNAGRNSLLSSIFAPRTDKMLFAATKADHIHHSQHEAMDGVMRHLVARAMGRAEGAGARVDSMALAAVRATREVQIKDGRDQLPAIAGVPLAGEAVNGDVFDGLAEAAIFPGELPADPSRIFDRSATPWQVRSPRFRPPLLLKDAGGRMPELPHMRLDRALEFLIGDHLA